MLFDRIDIYHLDLVANLENLHVCTTSVLPSACSQCHFQPHLTKHKLLLRALCRLNKEPAILRIKLDINFIPKGRRTAIQTPSLDACHATYDERLGIQVATAVGAEVVLVDLARVANNVVAFGRACSDGEGVTWDNGVGGEGAAGLFLAVGAVAEGGGRNWAC